MGVSYHRVVAAMGVALLAALGSAQAADPIKIGYSISKTGFLAVATSVQDQAYNLWREQVNARGGLDIGGAERRMVEFVVYDDQSDAGKIPQVYDKLLYDDEVELIMTPYATPLHVAMVGVVEKRGIPTIGNTASSTLIREMGTRYMFWTWPHPDLFVPVVVDFLESVGVKSAAMLTLQLPVNLEYKKFTLPLLEEKGIELKVNQEYPPDIKDMTTMVSVVKNQGVDAMIGYAYPSDSILYLNKAREMDVTAPVQFLLIGPHVPVFFDMFGSKLDGISTIGFWSPKRAEWQKAKPFHDAYRERWGVIPDYGDTVISYASAEILEAAVAAAGLDYEAMREHLVATTYDTIMGPIRFEKQSNVSTQPGISQIQNGVPELIYPPSIATSTFQPKASWD